MSDTPANNDSHSPWQGAFAVYGQVFEQVKANPAPALLFVIVYALFAGISVAAGENVIAHTATRRTTFEGVASLIFLLALPTYGLALADRKSISINEFMRFDLGKYLSIFAASILTGLAVAGSIILLIIPAIWTIAWFAAATYVVADTGTGPIRSLKTSKLLSRDHKGKVWGLIGVAFIAAFAAGLLGKVPVIGSAVAAFTSVLSAGAFASLYRWLQANAAAQQDEHRA